YAYVTGVTFSKDYPTVSESLVSSELSDTSSTKYTVDAFVSKLSPDGTALIYSTRLGGKRGGQGGGNIVLDKSGYVYVVGFTTSEDFPVTPGAFQSKQEGDTDVFITKLSLP
ncbi:MAG: SBBP repeat-containing protein, partial [Bacteroidia bacterium]